MTKRIGLNEQQIAEAKRLFHLGYGLRKIADAMGFKTRGPIKRALGDLKHKANERRIIPDELLIQIKILFEQKLGSRAIAAKLGIKRRVVRDAYQKLNLPSKEINGPPQKAYLQTEKSCGMCKIIKPVSEFREVYYEPTDRRSEERRV